METFRTIIDFLSYMVIFIAVVILLVVLVSSKTIRDYNYFEIGKTYEVTIKVENPFKEAIIDTITVIDIKKGFMLYQQGNYQNSCRIGIYDIVKEIE